MYVYTLHTHKNILQGSPTKVSYTDRVRVRQMGREMFTPTPRDTFFHFEPVNLLKKRSICFQEKLR